MPRHTRPLGGAPALAVPLVALRRSNSLGWRSGARSLGGAPIPWVALRRSSNWWCHEAYVPWVALRRSGLGAIFFQSAPAVKFWRWRSGAQFFWGRLFRPSSSLGGATKHAFLGCGAPAHRFLGWRSGAQVPWVLRGTLLRWRSGAEVAWVALHRSFFFVACFLWLKYWYSRSSTPIFES